MGARIVEALVDGFREAGDGFFLALHSREDFTAEDQEVGLARIVPERKGDELFGLCAPAVAKQEMTQQPTRVRMRRRVRKKLTAESLGVVKPSAVKCLKCLLQIDQESSLSQWGSAELTELRSGSMLAFGSQKSQVRKSLTHAPKPVYSIRRVETESQFQLPSKLNRSWSHRVGELHCARNPNVRTCDPLSVPTVVLSRPRSDAARRHSSEQCQVSPRP